MQRLQRGRMLRFVMARTGGQATDEMGRSASIMPFISKF